MNTQPIVYKEVQETLELCDSSSENSYASEFTLSFTELGLCDGGIFVFEDCPSSEELTLVDFHKADWAVQDRFEEFAQEVSSWPQLRRYINATQDHEEICQALNYLQCYGTPPEPAQNLLLIQAFNAWQQQQALFLAVPPVQAKPKQSFKI